MYCTCLVNDKSMLKQCIKKYPFINGLLLQEKSICEKITNMWISLYLFYLMSSFNVKPLLPYWDNLTMIVIQVILLTKWIMLKSLPWTNQYWARKQQEPKFNRAWTPDWQAYHKKACKHCTNDLYKLKPLFFLCKTCKGKSLMCTFWSSDMFNLQ